jgi:hypothetical protein
MNITLNCTQLTVSFAILFIVVGYVAPLAFAAYVPTDYYLEVNDFQAENVEVTDNSHKLCLDRDVRTDQTGTVFTDLYLVDGDSGERIEIGSMSSREYFQEGDYTIKQTMDLPEKVQPGTYRYVLVIQIRPAQGRVTRQVKHTSDAFRIYQDGSAPSNDEFTCT